MNSDPLMEELLSIEELLPDEEELWLDEEDILPVTRILWPTQF
jgi:hypothetical protein